MSREQVDLSPGQLLKLADLIHLQEVEKLKELKFNSYAEQQKYLKDAKDARDKVYHILDSTQEMIAEAEKDASKEGIAKDVYEYCTKGIETSLKFIRSYSTRRTYLDKLKSHSDDLIHQLKWLNPATQQKEAQRLALEAGMYKKATLENAKKFQHFLPNQFSKYLKENGIKFEDLVQSNMAKLGFTGPFKNLDGIHKLQVIPQATHWIRSWFFLQSMEQREATDAGCSRLESVARDLYSRCNWPFDYRLSY